MATILATNPHLVEATSGAVAWPEAIRRAIRDRSVLLSALGLPADTGGWGLAGQQAQQKFPLLVPWEFVARMQPGSPDDPLLRQVLVGDQEGGAEGGFVADPVDDQAATILPGLLQKYASRALLVTTGSCAVHCRYCFRREFPYAQVPKSPAAWQPAIDYLRSDVTLEEVILSGGDPLMLSDASLQWLVQRLNEISHIERLRIHTRLPVVIPQRVCAPLLQWVADARMQVVLVTHVNHPQEIDQRLAASLGQLRAAGVLLLNQAVLLRGVNDDVCVQRELSRRLIAMGVLPYYLHQLDRVQGAAHFEVPVEEGRAIITQLRAQFSGYGVPQYVSEQPGKPNKLPL